MSPIVHDMLQTAGQYCRLIEAADGNCEQWLGELTKLLPRLHAAMTAIEPVATGYGDPVHPDLDARFELFSHLRELLGERDEYVLEFDLIHDDPPMSGSLADDLTDIYCELKFGLDRLQSNDDPEVALGGWRHGFHIHWGQHLEDAERHLNTLTTRERLETSARH